jgi:YD repeat-containing protein
MKRTYQLFFLCVVILFVAGSCQKQYERPDVVITPGTGSGTGTGGSTGTPGSMLIKAEAKTTGNTTEASVTTYDYDENNRLIRITVSLTDSSNKTQTVAYRYKRDASGKIIQVISNVFAAAGGGGSGFGDSIYIDVHYPAGSSNFDYTKYSLDLGGISLVDSTVYIYANGVIVGRNGYSGVPPAVPVSLASRTTYEYTNQNLVAMKYYDQTSTATPIGTGAFEFDTKNAALSTGIEAFLPGQSEGCISKNNPLKETFIDNATTGNIAVLVNYTLQYNSNNYPVTGSLIETKPVAKTQTLKFTYK